jgi:hypothetical protein
MTRRCTSIHVVIAVLFVAFAAAPARAQQAPLQDKPFAEHKIVLQLSDNDPRKQGMVISVANNLMKFYDPDKVAVEIVAFGPGIDLLKPDNPNRKLVESLVAGGRAGRYLPQHHRYAGARDRQTAGIHPGCDAGPGRRRTDSAAHRKRLYSGPAVTVIASEAKQSIAPQQRKYGLLPPSLRSYGGHVVANAPRNDDRN